MLTPFDEKLLNSLEQKQTISVIQSKNIKSKVETGTKITDALQAAGVAEEAWVPILGQVFSVPFVDLTGKTINKNILDMIPQDLANNYRIIPFNYEAENKRLHIAMVDPGNFKAIEAVEFLARKQGWVPQYFIIGPSNFAAIIKQYESLGAEAEQVLTTLEAERQRKELEKQQAEEQKKEPLEEMIKSAPVSKMVEVIFKHAVEAKASDIHIEPLEQHSVVRYRIDGQLKISLQLPKHLHASVISRIKVMANLKIDETRIPQDGRIRIKVGETTVDMRISTLPLSATEKVVIRILDTSGSSLTFKDLGFMGQNLAFIEEYIKKPNGMFLVTGPTGSGKSTTLYSALNVVNEEEVNVVTLEDPIEYYLPGVNQSQVNPEVGYTFASGLRSILRQDPDIVMVGEIRDNETAELAIHAALTGHLVLSTLHTNDAIGAIPRFIDMKVEPFLLASTLNLVVAQRLVRKICPHCRQEQELHTNVKNLARDILQSIPAGAVPKDLNINKMKFYKGKGCARCGDSGYKGRVAIGEVLVMTSSLKEVVNANKMDLLPQEFAKQKTPTLRQDGVLKALSGITTMAEVITASK